LIGVIVDRQGSDAGVGRCGAADSPAQMGGESEALDGRWPRAGPASDAEDDKGPFARLLGA
jgi:hypothetical protein